MTPSIGLPPTVKEQRRLRQMRDLLTRLYLNADGRYHQPEERLHTSMRFDLQAAVDRYRNSPSKDKAPATLQVLRCLELYWGLYRGSEIPTVPLTQREVADLMGVSRGTVGRWLKLALELLVRDLDYDIRRSSVIIQQPQTNPYFLS